MANRFIDLQEVTKLGQEPVSVELAKAWAKIEYTTDDKIIDAMLTASRTMLEKETNVGFGIRTWQVEFYHDGENPYLLPYGPFVELISVEYRACKLTEWSTITTQEDDSFELEGVEFKSLYGEKGIYRIQYRAGYSPLPYQLQAALQAQFLHLYENRGDAVITNTVKQLLTGYNKVGWL